MNVSDSRRANEVREISRRSTSDHGRLSVPPDLRPVGDKVATSRRFRQILEAANKGDEVEHAMHRATENPFSAHGTAKRQERDRAPDPRQRPREPSS